MLKKRTPLIQAVIDKDVEQVKLLIKDGEDVNVPEANSGYSALMLACLFGHKILVKLLLDNEADISIRTKNETPLSCAIRKGRKDICELLFDIEPDILKNEGGNALVQASFDANMDIINYLLIKGVNINTNNSDGKTALIAASEKGNINLVKKLLRDGADINLKDNNGHTALMHSAMGGVVSIRTEVGSEPNMHEMEKARSEKLKLDEGVVSFLIESGADINAKDSAGLKALDHARNLGYDDIVKILESETL